MKYSQLVVWNFLDGAVYVLSAGPAAYGAGKVASGEQDWGSLGPLVAGLAIAAGCACARSYVLPPPQGHSQRAIARELSIDRRKVKRVNDQAA